MTNEIIETSQIIQIIENARSRAYKRVNEELIHMYWEIGEYLSNQSKQATFGDSYMDIVSRDIQSAYPPVLRDSINVDCIE